MVLDKSTWTRQLLEASGSFVLNVPCVEQVDITQSLGNSSGLEMSRAGRDKFSAYGLATFAGQACAAPLLEGCVAWLECRLLPEPHNHQQYDLFLGEVIAAQADSRVFSEGVGTSTAMIGCAPCTMWPAGISWPLATALTGASYRWLAMCEPGTGHSRAGVAV